MLGLALRTSFLTHYAPLLRNASRLVAIWGQLVSFLSTRYGAATSQEQVLDQVCTTTDFCVPMPVLASPRLVSYPAHISLGNINT